MAPQYKLTYFDFSGLGEPIRFLFYYGGIDFVDNRISKKDWPEIKDQMPLGQMPILEVNGRVLHQSFAITRYVAKQVGLVGNDDLENYEIDAAADTVNEVRLMVAQYYMEQDEIRKKIMREELDQKKLPFMLSKLDNWAKANKGYLANQKLSWADLYFTAVTGYLSYYFGVSDMLANHPNLITVRKNVLSIPGIKSWVDRRPQDNF